MRSRTREPRSAIAGAGDTARPPRRSPAFGVRARLLLAFLVITLIAALAAVAALQAFREVGERLELVDARAPVTLATLDLVRSTERIVAAAPALLATDDPTRRDALGTTLAAEIADVRANLDALRGGASGTMPLASLEPLAPLVVRLGRRIVALDALVERGVALGKRTGAARRALYTANVAVDRLLAPWLAVIDEELSALATSVERPARVAPGVAALRLPALLDRQHAIESIQRRFSTLVDTLSEASTSVRAERLPILDFRVELALSDLVGTAAGLDPRLRRLLLEQLDRVRELTDGDGSIIDTRLAEIRLLEAGRRQVAALRALSGRLGLAIDRIGHAAETDIGEAIATALDVQRRSTGALVVLMGLGLIVSALIVWLYVGRSVVRRLGALGDAMLAIAGGELDTPLETSGGDEIAAMGRAVEVFRRNTAERDALLERQARAAERLEHEVERRTAELRTANAFKARFLAAASHDLRQPLHALNLFVAQLRDTPDPRECPKLVQRIDASVASMNELFDALLDMARLESGAFSPCLTEFPLERVLERIETTFGGIAGARGLRLRVVPSRLWVCSDAVLLERILINLVANAVRYTDRGGVIVGCRRRGSRLRLDICDSGPGIPPTRQHEIFHEFRQLDGSRARRADGLGLGLAIVDGLSRLLEHPLELDSRLGRGTRFSISVPRATAQVAPLPPRPVAPIADPIPGKSIVVIDDDEPVLESMRSTLERWGCRVLAGMSEDVTIECLLAGDARPPDLIVSDYHLGGGASGIEAIARVRAALGRDDVPALLVSGDTAPEPVHAAAAAGLPLLHKPVTPMALRAMLTRLLGPAVTLRPVLTARVPDRADALGLTHVAQSTARPPR